ncbi:MAG: SpoVR family protein [Thermochromatium sp.]
MSQTLITDSSEWSFPLLERFDREIARLAHEVYGLDTYANQIEIISSEQMIDAYSSVGLPIYYHHWSFGKKFVATEQTYRRGQMGLAYEIVINSNPCIAYLMEENSLPMQVLVIAHACYGHNSFFKGNYLFRTWTSADAIIDYLVFARNYIAQCEERYGYDEVELLLDSCHALMNYGVDRYKRPAPLSLAEEQRRQRAREDYQQTQINDLWRTLPPVAEHKGSQDEERWPQEPQENILYFIEKNAPLLEPWQREIVRIVRKIGQYFYPQRQTQVTNEGWATFWHYTLMNHLYDEGLVSDGFMIDFLQSHTSVIFQPPFDAPYYTGINPYALGFAIMRDIRRICESPTDEDRYWFPDIAGGDWIKVLDFAMRNFKDESFIAQFLSPHLMREFRLFAITDDDLEEYLEVKAIHEESGYRALRQALAEQYNLGTREPNIQVYKVDRRGDRSLTLRHFMHNRRPLGDSVPEMLRHIRRLWGFTVRLETVDDRGRVELIGEV